MVGEPSNKLVGSGAAQTASDHGRPRTDLCTSCGKQSRHCHCLFDIRDPSAFVQGTINAFTAPTARRPWPIVLGPEEREELHQEGLAILYRLAGTFETRREGYEQDGRFSGYAAMFLPRKLGDAWHRMHPDSHRQVQDPETGKRTWVYADLNVSLEALTAEDPDRHQIMASQDPTGDLGERLHAALLARARGEYEWIVAVAKGVARQLQPREIAVELGLPLSTVDRHMRTQVRALPHIRHQWTSTSEIREHLEQMIETDAAKAARVGELLSQGSTVSDVAQIMEISADEVRDHMVAIQGVMHAIETEDR